MGDYSLFNPVMDFSPGGATRTPQTVIDLGAVPNLDNFGFYNSADYETSQAGTHQYPSGYDTGASLPSGNISTHAYSKAHVGAVGRVLENRGFGWLLEVEDNCDTQAPLLFKMLSIALGIFGVMWSVYSAGTLLCVDELQSKKPLLLYPVFLLYVYFFSLYSGV
ncbi:hypothetical protein GCK32_004732 [Trichostrongylus colubriformis]|uniref:Uncharacterized protein n=1 Tax=Trichostrongylus colubriformis TaxID=6319 RepID=A0AAN8ETL7_TRICO